MKAAELDEKGRLSKEYHPSVYLDTSILMEFDFGARQAIVENEELQDDMSRVLIQLFKDQNRWGRSRKLVSLFQENKNVHGIVSPISLIELAEKNAEENFRFWASSMGFATAFKRIGRKEMGDIFKQLLITSVHEYDQITLKGEAGSTPHNYWLNLLTSSQITQFKDLYTADLKGFGLSIRDVTTKLRYASFLQMGAADIIHLLIAKHLGCTIFATLDKDYVRIRDYYGDLTSYTITVSVEELEGAIMKALRC